MTNSGPIPSRPEKIPVLCCCDPSNLLGYAPAGLELATQQYEEEGVKIGVPVFSTAYVGEQLELSEWLDLPGFEPEPEIHLRRALELLDDVACPAADQLREQIELAKKGGKKKPTRKEGKK